jgi:putative ABC transport system permease protein
MRMLLHDIRYAVRTLRRRPWFALACILTIAIGIGGTTAVFMIADAVIFTPLSYPRPEQLLFVSSGFPGATAGGDQLSYLDIKEIAERNRTLAGIAAYNTGRALQMRGSGAGEPERVRANLIAPAYLTLLGAQVTRGRLFGPEDDTSPNGHPVVIVTHEFWERRLNADPAAVGRTLTLSDVTLTVVGVLHPAFRDVSAEEGYAFGSDVFIPVMMSPSFGGETYLRDRNARNYWALARVRDDVTVEQASADIAAIGQTLQREHSSTNRGFTFWGDRLDVHLSRDMRGPIVLLLAGSGFVLLIGCVNVANLLLVRLSTRERELAVRRAVGARGVHLLSMLFAESLVLAVAGGVLGLFIASAGSSAFRLLVPGELTPRLDAASLDWSAIVFAGLLTIALALALCLLAVLRPSSGRTGGTRRFLLVSEVAVAVVLVIAAGLMLDSLTRLRATDLGFRSERLLTLEMDLRSSRYAGNDVVIQFGRDLVRELGAAPGVEGALTWGPARPGRNTWVTFPGREDTPVTAERMMTWRHTVSPGALRAIGIPLLRGREFAEHDTMNAPRVAVVSETLARTLWPGEEAVGKRLRWRADIADSPLLTVVGVAADAKHRGRINDLLFPARDVYVPHAQRAERMVVAVVRASQDPASVVPAIRAAVRRIDPELPLFNVTMMTEHLTEEEAETRFAAVLMSAYGGIALLLAAIGIYGVVSYHVTLRTREVAVRLALGATRSEVLRLIVGEGMRPALAGIAIGLVAAFGLTHYLASLLFRVEPRDPVTFATVALVLTIVALAATWIPGRRATRIEPAQALRAE